MGPKPVRIGLKRKASVALNDDFSDEGDELMSQAVSVADHDETLAPLTNSTMKVLEKFVDLDLEKSISSVEDIFEDDIELDKDPDYVPEAEQEPAPTTSKGKSLLKPTAGWWSYLWKKVIADRINNIWTKQSSFLKTP